MISSIEAVAYRYKEGKESMDVGLVVSDFSTNTAIVPHTVPQRGKRWV